MMTAERREKEKKRREKKKKKRREKKRKEEKINALLSLAGKTVWTIIDIDAHTTNVNGITVLLRIGSFPTTKLVARPVTEVG